MVGQVNYYRKKPVVIEAVQLTKDNPSQIIEWVFRNGHFASFKCGSDCCEGVFGIKIYTIEGAMLASLDDFIIKGVKGEFYPCKPDIFKATYDETTV